MYYTRLSNCPAWRRTCTYGSATVREPTDELSSRASSPVFSHAPIGDGQEAPSPTQSRSQNSPPPADDPSSWLPNAQMFSSDLEFNVNFVRLGTVNDFCNTDRAKITYPKLMA